MKHRFFDEGDGGGTDSGAAGTEAKETPAPDAGKAPEGAKPEGDAGGKVTEKKESPEEVMTRLESEKGELLKKLGTQGNEIGDMRSKLKEKPDDKATASDKEAYLRKMADSLGMSELLNNPSAVKVDEDLAKTEFPGDDQKALGDMFNRQKQEILGEIAPDLAKVGNYIQGQKYDDYDALADDRGMVLHAMKTGKIAADDLIHYAARGLNMPAAIEDARKLGKIEAELEMAKKMQEVPDGGGSGPKQPSASEKEKQEKYRKHVFKKLDEIRR